MIKIGTIEIKDPVFLAPMSGVSDQPFRTLVKSFGAGLVFSEMIASREMLRESKNCLKINTDYSEEYPIAVQLAGCDPQIMAEAAKMNVDRGADIIDINFGCPVKKVVNKMAGSALMQQEDLAAEIMQAVSEAVSVPVTVKMRLGWDAENLNAPSLARKAEEIGLKMVTVHGRTRDQLYNGTADWTAVARVKEALTDIPLIINGDIDTPERAQQALSASGADGVMIGRACNGRPWLIRDIIRGLKGLPPLPSPSGEELRDIIVKHYQMIIAHYGPAKGLGMARKHLGWYCAGLPRSNALRAELYTLKTPEAVMQALNSYFDSLQNESPNDCRIPA